MGVLPPEELGDFQKKKDLFTIFESLNKPYEEPIALLPPVHRLPILCRKQIHPRYGQGEVRKFGAPAGIMGDEPRKNYRLYDYQNQDNFILKMDVRGSVDEVVLAKIPRPNTLEAGYQTAMKRMGEETGGSLFFDVD